jgi:hypothetical protein
MCGLASFPTRPARIRGFAFGICGLLSVNALAISSFLQPEEVRNAYSLGQTSNHEELVNFLKQYQHDFHHVPENTIAFAQSVKFQTPYEQIVRRALRMPGYSRFQEEEDYQANPDLVVVRVLVSLKNGYSSPAPHADNFRVVVSQPKPIEPLEVTSTVLCDPYCLYDNPTVANCVPYTREILLKFDAEQFAPRRATVTVVLPSKQAMQTTFDLVTFK